MTRQPAPQRASTGGDRSPSAAPRRSSCSSTRRSTTIAELGYHRATTAEICARAGVTHGALFHHFKTRVDLVLAALQRMTERRISRYVEFAEEVQAGAGDPLDLLRMVGQLARDDVAIVWAEITVAARTDPELRDRVEPAIDARWALIRAAAAAFPGLAVMEPRRARRVAAADARHDRTGTVDRTAAAQRRRRGRSTSAATGRCSPSPRHLGARFAGPVTLTPPNRRSSADENLEHGACFSARLHLQCACSLSSAEWSEPAGTTVHVGVRRRDHQGRGGSPR